MALAPAQPQQPSAPQGQPQGQPGQQPQQSPMAQLIIQTDKSLQQVAAAIGQVNPKAGQAFGQLEQQFKNMVTQFLQQAHGASQGQQAAPSKAAPAQAPMNAGAAPQQQAM